MNDWVPLILALIAPLVLLGLTVAGKNLAVRRGWIVRRAEPRFARETEEFSRALNDLAREIGTALLPAMESMAAAMARLFPPMTRRQRVALWLDVHLGWLDWHRWEYWVVALMVFAASLVVSLALGVGR